MTTPDVRMDWCEVRGRGSGRPLEGLHRILPGEAWGQMRTFCGVGISSAVAIHEYLARHEPSRCCKTCKRS